MFLAVWCGIASEMEVRFAFGELAPVSIHLWLNL